ncbi:MAG TPA: DedA family protein [Methanocella sp.]|uniref:DedA family protein n=1 Tax=Methanocella sp. TaxID=2052833 RepID=UPI002BEBCC30|nr:DedA family protein [Methanocella sp.]HTY89973.1 DedA family protein [Methanocella sp.]
MLSLAGNITSIVMDIIGNLGYQGIFILMTLESAGLPIPSEVIMPYGGFMASSSGIWHVVGVAVIGTLGTGLGSAIGYLVGAWGGKPFVDKYGKFFGVNAQKMLWAERWFCKYGEAACIYTRLLPVVRSIVNVPAGLLSMDFKKFITYSMLGAFPWCMVLAFIGYVLGENWQSIMAYSHVLTFAIVTVVVVIIAAAAVIYLLVRMGVILPETIKKYLRFIIDI